MRRMLLLLTWLAGLAGVLVLTVRLGRGNLAGPPWDPGGWSGWLETRAAPEAAMALVRLALVVVTAYLLVATALAVLAVPGLPTPGLVRTLVGAALLTGVVLAPAPGRRSAVPSIALVAASSDEAPTLRRLDAPTPETPPTAEPRTWTVQPGDHLWSIAERTLATALGRPPTDDEVVPFWRALVDANRDRLADPTNPDLVFAGQTFVVPEV